jgi:2-polyprenyl-6-methoxyphenol hydroxylase-like FAD-dependent oxidoreductase
MDQQLETVVVIGASIGGLAAAAAASRHSSRVIVLDRDLMPTFPQAPQHAAGRADPRPARRRPDGAGGAGTRVH